MHSFKSLCWIGALTVSTGLSACAGSKVGTGTPEAGVAAAGEQSSGATAAAPKAESPTAPGAQVKDAPPGEPTASKKADTKADAEQTAGTPSDATTAGQASSGKETAVAPSPEFSDGSHFSIVDLKLTEKIADRNPVEPHTTFAKGEEVFAWVKLNVKEPETPIRFQWYLNDAVVHTSDPVNVKQSTSWRSWQFKTVDSDGAWKVAILDQDDKVIGAQQFVVK